MSFHQLNVSIPEELYRELRRLVPSGERTRFLTQLTENGLRHLRFEKAARNSFGAWAKNDHPELRRGSVAHVNALRKNRRISRLHS